MKLATGVDLIEIARIEEVIARHGRHYLDRIYTPAELEQCGRRTESLAGRFAAKEAAVKALGCGIGDVSWKEVEILGDEQNAPVLTLHGGAWIEALAANAARPIGVEVAESNVLCLRFRELVLYGPLERTVADRGYDYTVTTPHVEEAVHGSEKVLTSMMEIAAYESRLKVLGEEILGVTRRIRVLEERVLPRLRTEIRAIAQYLGERQREAHYRLKRFKSARTAA